MLLITDSKFGQMLYWRDFAPTPEPKTPFYTIELSAIDALWATRRCDQFDVTALFVTRDPALATHIAGELNHHIMWLGAVTR